MIGGSFSVLGETVGDRSQLLCLLRKKTQENSLWCVMFSCLQVGEAMDSDSNRSRQKTGPRKLICQKEVGLNSDDCIGVFAVTRD